MEKKKVLKKLVLKKSVLVQLNDSDLNKLRGGYGEEGALNTKETCTGFKTCPGRCQI